MKIVDFDNPVLSTWFADQGLRLDPQPYVSDAYAASRFLERIPKAESLGDLTERIFHPGRASRSWITNREHGVPFLSSADIFQSDLSTLALITTESFRKNASLGIHPGWVLITRSGMTAGRVTYARFDMDGYACSEHVIRVVPKQRFIPAGYLYTYLASAFAIPLIKGVVYGTSVKHIEPSYLSRIPVPRLDSETEMLIDSLIREAMDLRARFQVDVSAATSDLFETAGLAELNEYSWHDHPRDRDFFVTDLSSASLRALNYSPRAEWIRQKIKACNWRSLGEICHGGLLRTGARFKRMDSTPENGVRLVGQRQAFWMRPEGRWINPREAPSDIRQTDETVLIAAHGTLGDSEVYSRSILVTGRWLENAFSQDFVRVRSGNSDFPGAYLFAFLRSEPAFRMLRSMSVGSKQQEYHPALLRDLPIPECTPHDRERIAATMRRAHRWRDMADAREDEAFALLGEALREAAR